MTEFYTPEVMRVLRYIIAVTDVSMSIMRGEIEAATQEEAIERMRALTFVHGMDQPDDQDLIMALSEMLISTVVGHISTEDMEGLSSDLLSLLPGASEARN